jgi:hypothetical protein
MIFEGESIEPELAKFLNHSRLLFYNTIPGKPFHSHYRNYKTTSGILFPYNEEDETGGQSYEVELCLFYKIINALCSIFRRITSFRK